LQVLTVCLCSCKRIPEEEHVSYPIFHIDTESDKDILFSELFESIEYIPLETTNKNLVGTVRKVIISNGCYFLLDKHSINAFDKSGASMFTINQFGRGVGEYAFVSSFNVDTINKNIEVFDAASMKFICYDLFTGQFKKEFKCPYRIDSFRKTTNGSYICLNSSTFSSGPNDYLYILDTARNLQNSLIPIPPHLYKVAADAPNNVFISEDYILFQPAFCDTVYSVTNTDYKPYYVFDFGSNSIDKKIVGKYESVAGFARKPYFATIPFGFLASKDFFYTSVIYVNEAFHVYYSNLSNTLIYGNQVTNDIDRGLSWRPEAFDGNESIHLIEPSNFLSHFEKIRNQLSEEEWTVFLDENEEIGKLINTSNENDNPIIMRCKLSF